MRKVGAMLRKALSDGILSVNNFSCVRKCRERFEERIGSEWSGANINNGLNDLQIQKKCMYFSLRFKLLIQPNKRIEQSCCFLCIGRIIGQNLARTKEVSLCSES
jgi:hypothetical protein